MLQAYADAFKVSERDLTKKALGKLKLWALLGLPATPLYAVAHFGDLSPEIFRVMILLTFISGAFLLVTMLSRFTNRFWARDKYLDEWELQRKHHSMAIGFQITDYLLCGIIFLAIILASFVDIEITLSFEHVAMIAFSFVVFMVYVPLLFLLWSVNPVDE